MTSKENANVLVMLPEEWSRYKKQYVRLARKGSTSPLWLGQKYDFAINRAKAKIHYTKEDLSKLEDAPEASVLQIRNEKGSYRFVKRNGKWVSATPED